MPTIQRELGDSQQQAAPMQEGFVSELNEFAVVQAAHNDVSAAKSLKTKFKIEAKKNQQDSRKNYDAVIHNMASHTAKLAVVKPKLGIGL
jgi:hypothetical protein